MGTLSMIMMLNALLMMFISPMRATRKADSCSNTYRCPPKDYIQYIHVLLPVSGSQLQMSECRIRYVVENAPEGAYSRIIIGDNELVFYRDEQPQTKIFGRYVDESIVLHPGTWVLKVSTLIVMWL